jgi:phospholipase/carboxylesterase
MSLDEIGAVRCVFPHAPVRPVTINGGMAMRAWYDIRQSDLGREEDEAGLRESQLQIEALIARERERGVPASRIVLMGFSQGCAMTLQTGLRHAERLAGLVGLSGYLPLPKATASERSAASTALPIFLAHGRYDPMISLARATTSRGASSARASTAVMKRSPESLISTAPSPRTASEIRNEPGTARAVGWNW